MPACGPAPIHVSIDERCEWLSPVHCALPYPTDRFTVEDPESPTGRRLALSADAFPQNVLGDPLDPRAWNRLDGFSTGPTILTAFEHAIDPSNLPGPGAYDASLRNESPTVILGPDGERVAHFAENDGLPAPDEPVAFYLRPARRLAEGAHYIVALRNLRYEDGTAVAPSEAFRALRDGVPTDVPAIEARRPHFEDLFAALEAAGVDRHSLILAWDFTTASGESIRGDLLAMRDDAMARVGARGLGCTVTHVEEPGTEIYRRVDGTFTMPSYMSSPDTLSTLVRGEDGRPVFQGMVQARFVANIPASLAEPGAGPGRLVTYAHGQLGSPEEVIWSGGRRLAQDLKAVLVSTDMLGMAEVDLPAVLRALSDVSTFDAVTDRLHQGMVAHWVLTRTMAGLCADDPAFQVGGHRAFDPQDRYFIGISQGAILGWTYLALAQDLERGVLNVGGANYAFIVDRSHNFIEFEDRFENWYERRIDRRLLLVLMEQLWEHAEGWGYLEQVIQDPPPNTPPKKVLLTIGKNDTAVPNLSAEVAARSAGLPLIDPPLDDLWGFEHRTPPYDGSGLMAYDLGDPPVPAGDAPPAQEGSVHGRLRFEATHMAQLDAFLRPDGQVIDPCDGPCDPD